MKTAPHWINRELFPFESKWMTVEGSIIHYVDEGPPDAPVLVFVHGTPEWSFGYRDLILLLRKEYRCVAIDHLGFGLSDKPSNGDYRVEAHANRLASFIGQLGLQQVTLVANDFGGGFALDYALGHTANIRSIVLFNTWMRSLRDDPHYAKPARVVTTWLGKFLYLYLNAPVNMIMPAAFGDRKKLTKEVHRHYRMAVPDRASRVALFEIARELMNASSWWQSRWEKLDALASIPTLIFWGMKDKFIPPSELERWKQRWPSAKVTTFPDAGHFVQEEKAQEMGDGIRALVTGLKS